MISDRLPGPLRRRHRGVAVRLRLPFAVAVVALAVFAAHTIGQRVSARTALAEGEEAFQRGDFGRAADRFHAVLAINPASTAVRLRLAAALVEMSAASWARASGDVLDAEARAGLLPASGHPVANDDLRRSLSARWSPAIAEGIDTATKAVTIDREHENAMLTLNAWHQLAADLAASPDEYRRHTIAADEWRHKALDARRLKAERGSQ